MRTSIDARANLDLIEENYRRWQQNPESVDSGWSAFFEGFELGNLPSATVRRWRKPMLVRQRYRPALMVLCTRIACSVTPLRVSIRWRRRGRKIRCSA